MESRRRPGNGVRGWSVIQERRRLLHMGAADERSVRELFAASRGGILRVAFAALGVGLMVNVLFGVNGVLRLKAMRGEVAALSDENARLQRQHDEVIYQLGENPGLAMERVMREQYRKALPNEVVYHARTVPSAADSTAGSDVSPKAP